MRGLYAAHPSAVRAIVPLVVTLFAGLAVGSAIVGHARPLVAAVLWPLTAAAWCWIWWMARDNETRRWGDR